MNSEKKVFTGFCDRDGNPINEGDTVQWGAVGKFHVFRAPRANGEWGMAYTHKLPHWDGRTADYFLSVFDDDKDRQLKCLEKV